MTVTIRPVRPQASVKAICAIPNPNMHPDLKKLADGLNEAPADLELSLRFSLKCIEDVANNLEDASVIEALAKFKACVMRFDTDRDKELTQLASLMNQLAGSHPGSQSIDGTRHAAVSATYALAKAVNNKPIEAAAYAAYSYVYGYGGYAVTDPDSFAEVHQRQMQYLRAIQAELAAQRTHPID